jgi:hypothetical protein
MAPKMPVRRQQADRPANLDEDGVLKAWQQAYPLPDDAADNSRADVKMLYRSVLCSFSRTCMVCVAGMDVP